MLARLHLIILLLISTISLSFANIVATNPTDKDIESSAISEISKDKKLKNLKVEVSTTNGVVVVKGDAIDQGDAGLLVEVLQSLPGVKDVEMTGKNKDDVNSNLFDDMIISAKVIGKIAQEKVFGDLSITKTSIAVDTKDGVVTLNGHAKSHAQAAQAVEIAKSIKGVTKVNSNIEIN